MRSAHFDQQRERASALIRQVLDDNPFTTLQVVLEPTGEVKTLRPRLLEALLAVCQASPTYLDKFYALQPGRANGAKRLSVVLPLRLRAAVDPEWLAEVGESASVVWRGTDADVPVEEELEVFEYAWM